MDDYLRRITPDGDGIALSYQMERLFIALAPVMVAMVAGILGAFCAPHVARLESIVLILLPALGGIAAGALWAELEGAGETLLLLLWVTGGVSLSWRESRGRRFIPHQI